MQNRSLRATLSALALTSLSLLSASAAHADLTAFYPFTGGSLADFSGNGNTGVFGPTAPTVTASGFQGEAFEFGATADTFITIPVNINASVMPQITFGAWANADVANNVIRGILSHDNVNFDRTIGVDVRGNGGGLRWSAFTGGGVTNNGTAAGLVTPGEWVFLAVRHDQNTGELRFHINDIVVALSGQTFGPGLTQTTIGRNPTFDSPFDGRIDNVFIFNEFLSDARMEQIRTLGEAGIVGSAAAAPEPSSMTLLLMGGVGLALRLRRRTR